VDNEYFTALGLRFRRGSSFSDPNSIVVNTTAAAQLFGDSDPIGALVDIDQVGQRRIAGVVEDSRFFTVDERPEPQMYEPIDTDFPPTVAVIVKAKGQVDGVLSDVRLILSQGDRAMPSIELMTMQRHIDLYFGRARLMALASAILAGLGLLISVAGTIVIGSFVVRSRMHEAAVRLALGEQRLELFSRMAFHGLAWGTAGVATGVFLAQQVVNLSAQLMFGITATDRTTFAIPVMFVMLSLLVGVGSAALTAARMDPVDKLKVTV
jgi:ABC-type antimicrobial peptide transport system permease subunit